MCVNPAMFNTTDFQGQSVREQKENGGSRPHEVSAYQQC